MQKRAAERNQELRDDWIKNKLTLYTAEQLIFVDESAANERSAHRKCGWAPIGATPHMYLPLKRSERFSILPAYTSEGFMDWEIIQGSFNTELFNFFIKTKILPFCNEYPGPRSILIMDNAPIHHSEVYLIVLKRF
jgi:hypothetical protein